ncbi:hypothetical protein SMKC069_16590 [Serratia marcescens]|nr:hypothetical protein SMKC069_16590 [Serratia marcescens]
MISSRTCRWCRSPTTGRCRCTAAARRANSRRSTITTRAGPLQEQRDDGSRRSWSYDPASPWSPLAALEQAGDSRSADIYWYHTDLNSAPLEVTDAGGQPVLVRAVRHLRQAAGPDGGRRGEAAGRAVSAAAALRRAIPGRRKRPALQPVPLLRARGGAFHHAGSDRVARWVEPVSVCAEPADVGGSVGVICRRSSTWL